MSIVAPPALTADWLPDLPAAAGRKQAMEDLVAGKAPSGAFLKRIVRRWRRLARQLLPSVEPALTAGLCCNWSCSALTARWLSATVSAEGLTHTVCQTLEPVGVSRWHRGAFGSAALTVVGGAGGVAQEASVDASEAMMNGRIGVLGSVVRRLSAETGGARFSTQRFCPQARAGCSFQAERERKEV